jgi:microcompartment protein CcmL/EutN
VDVADAAAKAANVTLFRVHLAMALGGKGFVLLTGDVASVQAAVDVGAAMAGSEGILVGKAVIAAPRVELFREFI